MVVSVAKRLVPSAVRRNTVKRIAREAWRAAVIGAGSGAQRSLDLPGGAGRANTGGLVCLVRLKRYPGAVVKAKAGVGVKAESVKAKLNANTGKPVAVTPPGFATVKRHLRADADRLFAAFLQHHARAAGQKR
jgi:hypothetical protein